MTRSVTDAAAVLAVIAGHDPRDPTSLGAPVPDYGAACGRSIAGMRVGIDERYATEGMDDAVTGPILAAARALERAGALLVPVTVPYDPVVTAHWVTLCGAEVVNSHAAHYPERQDEYGPAFAAFIEAGRAVTGAGYAAAHEYRLELRARLSALLETVDALACPTLGVPTPAIDAPAGGRGMALTMKFTAPFDLSGQPTLSLPCGPGHDGMPLSLQLVGRHLGEATLLALGAAFEREAGQLDLQPPLAR
jgi:amidase